MPTANRHRQPLSRRDPTIWDSSAVATEAAAEIVDLAHRDLENANFEGRAMPRARLAGSNLRAARFSRADLAEADLFGADLARADLQQANLTRAILRGTNLRGANLNNAILVDADFRGGVMMRPSNARGGAEQHAPDFSSARVGSEMSDLSNCLLDYATASRAQFSGVDLSGASMVGADLSGANFFGSSLRGADLSYANLSGANLSDSRLIGTRLIGANLSGAQIVNATVENVAAFGTDFAGAILRGVDTAGFSKAPPPLIASAHFAADLTAAIAQHRAWMQTDGAGGQQLNLAGQRLPYHDFSGLELDGADFSGCDLRGCSFDRASLLLASFTRTNLTGASFQAARIAGVRFNEADLRWADLQEAVPGELPIYLGNGRFSGRHLATDFTAARLESARLDGFDLAAFRR
jgi:uncharacterized protein YjbI with pentapeptide repeats